MEMAAVVERAEEISAVRSALAGEREAGAAVEAGVSRPVDMAAIESALVAERELRAWLDASNAALIEALAERSSFPERTIAAASKSTLAAAGKALERSRTLAAVPEFAAALDEGEITAGHVDAISRAGQRLDPAQRAELHGRVGDLVGAAASTSIDRFGRKVSDLARNVQDDDGIDRFERQRRDTSLRTWVGKDGMWNVRGRYDPLTGVELDAAIGRALEVLFAEATPDGCPADPVAKQDHLRALAVAGLLFGQRGSVGATAGGTAGGAGRPEYVIVVDAGSGDASSGSDGSDRSAEDDDRAGHLVRVDWPIPVEVPARVLLELLDDADVHAVVVRNGVVLHAPGELNLGRTTRIANRAQRRALRGLYATCAIPRCATHYDRCKLHHVIWWRNGGRTDLDNLLPLCVHHHHEVHDSGWQLDLGPNRELTIVLPDGTVRNTGPPNRRAA